MPRGPTTSQVHVDRPLTQMSIRYEQDSNDFIAGKIFGEIPVAKESDDYWVWENTDFKRVAVQKRAPGTESAGGVTRVNTEKYSTEVFAVHQDLALRTIQNADDPLNLEEGAVAWIMQQLLLKKDIDFVNKYFNDTAWDHNFDVTALSTPWDQPGSEPIKDLRKMVQSIKRYGGRTLRPNVLALGSDSWAALQDNDEWLDRVNFGTTQAPSEVSLGLLAQILELDEVVAIESVQNISNEGAATEDDIASFDFIGKDGALLCHRAMRPGINTPSAGYIFNWNHEGQGGSAGQIIDSFDMRELKARRFEGEMAYDQKVVDKALGAFLKNTLA